jgi:hypothetical protein
MNELNLYGGGLTSRPQDRMCVKTGLTSGDCRLLCSFSDRCGALSCASNRDNSVCISTGLAAKGSPDGGALRQRQRSLKATSRNDGFMQE